MSIPDVQRCRARQAAPPQTWDDFRAKSMHEGPRRVLVIEDNSAMSNVIRFNLERAGYEVATAANGLEGVRCVQSQQFHLIITDQQMPVMDGTEFCTEMRKLDAYQDVPTIMLTAKGLELELPRLREELGITALFPKPFSPSELVKAVGNCFVPAV